ncbi:MAG: T9SS type A sorting domain-containing protein [Crocinitomicaceae bacterium]|nr:T9SS type A sorting domain-containing protein [Crocinitomicaceae bacterium]MBK8926519.1 T9SS type A sorting domain-containing protein [Crocinitomicaceae bacterium]
MIQVFTIHFSDQRISAVTDDQIMPWINNMTEQPGFTFLENFMWNIGHMIQVSYDHDGPLKSSEQGDDHVSDSSDHMILDIFLSDTMDIKIYPNPVESILVIESQERWKWDNVIFQFVDANGRVVIQDQLDSQIETINLTDIEPGFYYVKIQSEDGVFVFPISKL